MEKSVAELDFVALTARPYFPSPTHWEDEVLYFLMLDRFSDGAETNYLDNAGNLVAMAGTPLFSFAADVGNAVTTEADASAWRKAGGEFVGGTLAGPLPAFRVLVASRRDGYLGESHLSNKFLPRRPIMVTAYRTFSTSILGSARVRT